MGLAIDSANIECLYLRASCYHAIGLYKEAVWAFSNSSPVTLNILKYLRWLLPISDYWFWIYAVGEGLWCRFRSWIRFYGKVCASMLGVLSGK